MWLTSRRRAQSRAAVGLKRLFHVRASARLLHAYRWICSRCSWLTLYNELSCFEILVAAALVKLIIVYAVSSEYTDCIRGKCGKSAWCLSVCLCIH